MTSAGKCGVTDSASNMVRAIQRVQQVYGSVLTFGFHRCVEREPRHKDKAHIACQITGCVTQTKLLLRLHKVKGKLGITINALVHNVSTKRNFTSYASVFI